MAEYYDRTVGIIGAGVSVGSGVGVGVVVGVGVGLIIQNIGLIIGLSWFSNGQLFIKSLLSFIWYER